MRANTGQSSLSPVLGSKDLSERDEKSEAQSASGSFSQEEPVDPGRAFSMMRDELVKRLGEEEKASGAAQRPEEPEMRRGGEGPEYGARPARLDSGWIDVLDGGFRLGASHSIALELFHFLKWNVLNGVACLGPEAADPVSAKRAFRIVKKRGPRRALGHMTQLGHRGESLLESGRKCGDRVGA